MAIASLYPTIKPSLLLDFANSKKLDPRVTFTRSTTAVYYDGVTSSKAEENLLLRSQDYSATWAAASLTPVTGKTAPDGTATATEFTASGANGTLTQSVTAIAAEYTFSVYLRRVTGTGDIDITADSGGTWVTQTITSSWARYTVTQTLTAGTRTPGIRIVTSGDQIEVWGAQLEQRSAATAYTPTTTQAITNYIPTLLTAPAGVPRFDHNPTTGESLGLLVEEQGTNLLTYSQEFDNAAWTKANVTVSANSVVAPDGTTTADTLIENTALAEHSVSQVASNNGGNYTFTCYTKASGRTFARLKYYDSANNRYGAVFNLSTGAVTNDPNTGSGVIVLSSTLNVGNGWWRLSITGNAPTIANAIFEISMATSATTTTNPSVSYTGDGTSGIYIWGAQLETGAFPTSYIPTTSASVTRTADAASMTGANFSSWYNSNEGSVQVTSDNSYIRLSVNTYPNNINTFRGLGVAFGTDFSAVGPIWGPRWLSQSNNTVYVGAWNYNGGGTEEDANINNTIPVQIINTIASAISASGSAVSAFGLVASAGDDPTRSGLDARFRSTAMRIGQGVFNIPFSGTVKKIAYYPQRLTNAQLQALTA